MALCACGADATDAQSTRACDRLASPGHRAVQRLVDSLRPGQVGCLRQGTYRGAVTIRRSGEPGQADHAPAVARARAPASSAR